MTCKEQGNAADLCAGEGLLSQVVLVAALFPFLMQQKESIGHIGALDQWFATCAPRIPVPRGSADTFL